MKRKVLPLLMSVFCAHSALALEWTKPTTWFSTAPQVELAKILSGMNQIYQMDLEIAKLNPEDHDIAHKRDLLNQTISAWAATAAKLDPTLHNWLLFTLLEHYLKPHLARASGTMILSLHSAIQPQLETQRSAGETAEVALDSVSFGLALFAAGRGGYSLAINGWGVYKNWRQRFEGAAANENAQVPALTKTAALEFERKTVSSFLQRVKSWRPGANFYIGAIAGVTEVLIQYYNRSEEGRLQGFKLPPRSMLQLVQIGLACDLGWYAYELERLCSGQQANCRNSVWMKREALKILTRTDFLVSSFPSLDNLDVRQHLKVQKDLLSRIPAKHQGLFQYLFTTKDPDRACRRVVLNQTNLQSRLKEILPEQ